MSGSEDPRDHGGHRRRQREKLLKLGGYVLTDREVLEMILYYALPRVNTAPIADELLARFGSIKGVLDASRAELRQIKGVKDGAEALFRLLRQVSLRDIGCVGKGDYRNADKAIRLLCDVFKDMTTEAVYALYLDENGALLGSEFVFYGEASSARFPMRAVTEGVLMRHGWGVILAHNHPSGSVFPSSDDILTTERIAAHLAANDITLVEHYIVGSDECAAVSDRRVIRRSE